MSIFIICAVSLLLSLLITIFITPKILLISARKRLLDIPNGRKIHKNASSRLGGVAFFPSLFMTICAIIAWFHVMNIEYSSVNGTWLMLSLGAGFMMYFVGISDDIKGVSYRTKFMCQIIASCLIIASKTWINNLYGIFGIYEIPLWIGIPLTSLFLVFVMNSINLIDGIDGLSSGLSIVILGFYGVVFIVHNQLSPAIVSFATIGTLMGFFRYNFFGFSNRSIKMFMGDTGTLFIGTIIGLLALKLVHFDTKITTDDQAEREMLIAYSVLVIPCFDVIRVMLHRLKNGKGMFSPDKNHIHHKILALGFSTKQTLFIILGFSVLLAIVNLIINRWIALEYIILINAIGWIIINMLITKKLTKKYES